MPERPAPTEVRGSGGSREERDPQDDGEQSSDLFRAVGKQIRVLRERAGLTRRELGDRLGYGEDLISSVERGRCTPQRELLEAADELLGAGGLLKTTIEDVEKAKAKARVRHPPWFRDYAWLEADAVEVNDYSDHDIPGLFQERRARALYEMRKPLLDEETIEQRVASRLAFAYAFHDLCLGEKALIRARWAVPVGCPGRSGILWGGVL